MIWRIVRVFGFIACLFPLGWFAMLLGIVQLFRGEPFLVSLGLFILGAAYNGGTNYLVQLADEKSPDEMYGAF